MVHHNINDPSKVIDVAFEKKSSFEERCWFFFRKYSRYWTYVLCFLVGIGLLVAMTLWVKELYGRHVENRFTALQTPEDKAAFAESYTSHPLAGICLLELADLAYQAQEYTLAAKRYERAQTGLKYSIFGGRAALGRAMSLWRSGEVEEGRIGLLSAATQVHYPQSIRAEAFYLTAILAMDRGKPHKAKQALQYLANGDYGEVWEKEAQELAKNYRIEL
jgi:hypothetical protein